MTTDWSAIADALRRGADGTVIEGHPIGPMTTYRVGGSAAVYFEPSGVEDLSALTEARAAHEFPILTIGLGSNMLVADRGFEGVALHLGEVFAEVSLDGSLVVAGAAASLPIVARKTVAAALTGFEWAVGVPGSIGGAVRMNAGGHGSDMAASVVGARIFDLVTGTHEVWTPTALGFGYRTSALRARHCVLDCHLQLAAGDREQGEELLSEVVRWRRANQPGGTNAGSVFTNPPEDSAGRLIDSCGGKGLRVGTAQVSTKHANFIQADEGGSADDILALMREVIALVEERAGVRLHPETHLVGYEPEPMIAFELDRSRVAGGDAPQEESRDFRVDECEKDLNS